MGTQGILGPSDLFLAGNGAGADVKADANSRDRVKRHWAGSC